MLLTFVFFGFDFPSATPSSAAGAAAKIARITFFRNRKDIYPVFVTAVVRSLHDHIYPKVCGHGVLLGPLLQVLVFYPRGMQVPVWLVVGSDAVGVLVLPCRSLRQEGRCRTCEPLAGSIAP